MVTLQAVDSLGYVLTTSKVEVGNESFLWDVYVNVMDMWYNTACTRRIKVQVDHGGVWVYFRWRPMWVRW